MNPAQELNRILALLGAQPLDLEALELRNLIEEVETEMADELKIPDDLKGLYNEAVMRSEWDTIEMRPGFVQDLVERIARLEQQLANARRDALKYIAQEAARKATKELFSFMDIKFERGKSYANSREETVAIVIEQNIRALIDKETQ